MRALRKGYVIKEKDNNWGYVSKDVGCGKVYSRKEMAEKQEYSSEIKGHKEVYM